MKQQNRALILMTVIFAALAIAVVAYAAGRTSTPVAEVVKAKRFELVDDTGKTRAVLAITPDLGAALKLTGDGQWHRRSANLSAQKGVVLYDESGNQDTALDHRSLSLSGPGTGSIELQTFSQVVLTMQDRDGVPVIVMNLDEAGWPRVTFITRHPLTASVLTPTREAGTGLWVTDLRGQVVFKAQ